MNIREAQDSDFDSIWPIFHEIASAGETYALDRDTNKDQARVIWMESTHKTFVVEESGEVLGTYFYQGQSRWPWQPCM